MKRAMLAMVGAVLFGLAGSVSAQTSNYSAKEVPLTGYDLTDDGSVVGEKDGFPAVMKTGGQATRIVVPGVDPAQKGKAIKSARDRALIEWAKDKGRAKRSVTKFDGTDVTPKKSGSVKMLLVSGLDEVGNPVGNVGTLKGDDVQVTPASFSPEGTARSLPHTEGGWVGMLTCKTGEWSGGYGQHGDSEDPPEQAVVIKPSGAWELPASKDADVLSSATSAVTKKGEAVGEVVLKSGKKAGFVWTPTAGYKRLPEGSKATDIAADGIIVGTASGHAALLDRTRSTWIDLNTVTTAPPTTFAESVAVNDKGQILVRGADGKSYVLTPESTTQASRK